MLTTHNSLATQAVDVLFHPTSRTRTGACPLLPPAEAEMDQAGISRAIVSQCKRWSCERQWMCVDTRLEDVLRYTDSSPRYAALAGYNPFDIAESLREIELAVTVHVFRGVYLHAASFNLPLTDARLYPLFAKAAELAVPVLIQLPVGLDLHPELNRLAADFPGLAFVLAQPCPRCGDIASLAAQFEDVFFALDPEAIAHLNQDWSALAPARGKQSTADGSAFSPECGEAKSDFFSGVFQERCMWGSNGMDWPDALRAAASLPLLPETEDCFLRQNAERVFAFDQPPASRMPRSALHDILVAER